MAHECKSARDLLNKIYAAIMELKEEKCDSGKEADAQSRRNKVQERQLALAYKMVQDDPLHNVKRAAERVFRMPLGYRSVKSFENVLRREWNRR